MKSKIMQKRQRQKGFSLLELMMGLIIISIISGFLVWSGSSFLRTYRVRMGMQEVYGMLTYAHNQAITTRRTYLVHLVSIGNKFNGNANTRGGIHVQQGAPDRISKAFVLFNPPLNTNGLESKYIDFSKSFQNVVIAKTTFKGASSTPKDINVFFRPDGRVERCVKSGTKVSCQPGFFTICVRAKAYTDSKTGQKNIGPDAISRQIEVEFNGLVRILKQPTSTCP